MGQTPETPGKESVLVLPLRTATVYYEGALLERSGSYRTGTGSERLVVGGLDTNIVAGSVEVALPAGWKLLGTQFRLAPSGEGRWAQLQAMDRLDAQIAENRLERAKEEALLAAFEEEQAMLRANRAFGGTDAVMVEDLREMADFWRNRMQEIGLLALDVRQQMAALDQTWKQLEEDRKQLENFVLGQEGQILLQFEAPPAAQGTVVVRYLTRSARWTPHYTVQWTAEGNLLGNKWAEVRQSTGTPWAQIPVRFAAGSPLEPRSLERRKEVQAVHGMLTEQEVFLEMEREDSEDRVQAMSMAVVSNAPQAAGDASGNIRSVWQSTQPIYVASGDSLHRVPVGPFELRGTLTYLGRPTEAAEARRRVRVADWSSHDLLPGPVEMRLGDLYLGRGYLALPVASDSLTLLMGSEVDVRVERSTLRQSTKRLLWLRRQKHAITWRYDVVNRKNTPVQLEVEDILRPDWLNAYSSYRVEVRDAAGGDWVQATGQIRWQTEIPAGGSRSWEVRFVVRQPG